MRKISSVKMLKRLLKRKCGRVLFFWTFLAAVLIIYLSGLDLVVREVPYEEFSYQLRLPDKHFRTTVREYRSGSPSAIQPVYKQYSSLSFRHIPEKVGRRGCDHELLILIKSAPKNFGNRAAIRETWGKDSGGGVFFFVGNPEVKDTRTSFRIEEEERKFGDLVLLNFADTYFNNTAKTVMELRFAAETCSGGSWRHALLIDDDYWLSIKGVRKLLVAEEEEKLYGGFVFPASKPLRHRVWNKWFVPLAEYPFSRFPPYVTAGSVLLSKEALLDFHAATGFIEPFRFDDIYLGIMAKKLGIVAKGLEGFRFWEVEDESLGREGVIAAHGFPPERLRKVWNFQIASTIFLG